MGKVSARPWARLQARVYRTESVCALCGQIVDKTLAWPHPLSKSVDHIVPLAKGGAPLARSNVQLAHLKCNRDKWTGDKVAGVNASRDW